MGDLERRRYSLSPMDARTEVRLTRAQRLALREVEVQGSIDRQAAIEEGKLAATQIDVVMAAAARATVRADELSRMVWELGAENERGELAGGRFYRVACRKAERLIDGLYDPLGG